MIKANIVIVGAGAFARELLNYIDDINSRGFFINVNGFVDENANALAPFDYNLEHLGGFEDYIPSPGVSLLVAVGNPATKKSIFDRFKPMGVEFFSLIHPTAIVARTALLGEGVVLCPHSLVAADAKIGNLVAVNVSSSIGHDVMVGSYSTLSAHVDLTGGAKVGEKVFFGSGSRVLPGIAVANGARVGAGSIVMKNVAENAVIYSSPAKVLYTLS